MYIWMNHEFTSLEKSKKMVGQKFPITYPLKWWKHDRIILGNKNKNGMWTSF